MADEPIFIPHPPKRNDIQEYIESHPAMQKAIDRLRKKYGMFACGFSRSGEENIKHGVDPDMVFMIRIRTGMPVAAIFPDGTVADDLEKSTNKEGYHNGKAAWDIAH